VPGPICLEECGSSLADSSVRSKVGEEIIVAAVEVMETPLYSHVIIPLLNLVSEE
jgi:hypothetical protein